MSQIERCLEILESLHAAPGGYPLSYLSEKLAMPKSAVHRLLAALKDRGYVDQEGETGIYRATLKLSLIGAKYFSVTDLRGFMDPVLTSLGQNARELARLSLLIGKELTWVLSYQGGDHTLRYDGHSGRAVVPHVTATGRVWLATMSDENALAIALNAGLGNPEQRHAGTRSITTVQELLDELRKTRERGYGLVEEEAEIGISSVACAIYDHESKDRFVGAVSIAGPSIRLTKKRMEELVPMVRSAADELSAVLFRYQVYCGAGGSLTDTISSDPQKTSI